MARCVFVARNTTRGYLETISFTFCGIPGYSQNISLVLIMNNALCQVPLPWYDNAVMYHSKYDEISMWGTLSGDKIQVTIDKI